MSLDQTQDLVSGELWLLVPVEEEVMHSLQAWSQGRRNTVSECLYLAQGQLRKPTIKMPVFLEGPLQTSSRPLCIIDCSWRSRES